MVNTKSPLKQGGFSCFSDTPHREGTWGGVLVTVAVWLAGEYCFTAYGFV